ncbi:MAG TPA: YkgJ family cysteine cluster protein [Anaeromyxobacter sp.]|nr:YkgJ family cysteine cluster protein [Anaeromyxobacter sp.]
MSHAPSPSKRAAAPLPEPLANQRRLGADSTFCFDCGPGLECFTRCCSDVNIVLTPADVLALARRTGLATREFLDRHTLTPITKDLHLPVVMLKMGDAPEKRCPFVSAQGCAVYEARPWACRMYPVGMALPPARPGVEPEPTYFLFEDDFCHGRRTERTWTVAAWERDQGLRERDDLEKGFRELVGHPWFIGGRQLDPRRIELFHMAAYDLDTFRAFIFSTSFVERFDLDRPLVEALRTDDHALLRFAFRWLRFALFGEPTVQLRRPSVMEGARP